MTAMDDSTDAQTWFAPPVGRCDTEHKPHSGGVPCKGAKIVRLAAAVLLAGGMTAGTTGSASASEPRTNAKLQSCLGGALTYTSYPGSSSSNSYWPERGNTAAKSSWEVCKDINIKTNSTRDVTVCFVSTGSCNGWHRATVGQWKVVASSVLPGTSFYLQFKGTARSTFKLAF